MEGEEIEGVSSWPSEAIEGVIWKVKRLRGVFWNVRRLKVVILAK